MIVAFVLLAVAVPCALSDDAADKSVVDKSVTLKGESAYVTFAPFQWNLKGDGEELILPFRFRTRSSRGRLLTLTAGAPEEKLFTLSALVESSAIVMQIADGSGEVLKTTERQIPGANNGLEHSMSIHFNPKAQQLKVVFAQGTVDSYEDIKGIPAFEQTSLSVSLGKYGEKDGVLGCVTLVGLSIGGNFDFAFTEVDKSPLAVDGCETLCDAVECNSGTCVDLFEEAVCSCRGTHMAGAHCSEEMRSLNVSWDQFIAYQISDRESQPTTISVEFKTLVKEGVLIHGSFFSTVGNQPLGDMKLALIYGQLRLTIADFLEINFYNVSLTSERFHKVQLRFDYARSEVELSFDDEKKTAVCTTEGDFRFGNEVYFSAGGSEVGISGCLQEIYVDYFDVIDGYYKKSTKVSASHVLQNCGANDDEVAAVENLANFVNDASEKQEKEPLIEYQHRIPASEVDEADIDSAVIQQKIEAEIDAMVDSKVANVQEPFIAEQSSKKQLCDNDEATYCKNFIECVIKESVPTCICKKGFAGEFCQFSLLPRNCDEVRLGGDVEAGTYVVDVDGSGPLLETYVYCKDGDTIVPHNMPNATMMRSSSAGDLRFLINYRLFSEEQLKLLRDSSEGCTQYIRYDCRAAPLGFASNKTWFSSPGTSKFAQLTHSGSSCQCNDGQCSQCSCDGGGITTDEGTLRGSYVPLTNIYALNDPSDEQGLITLGPLQCSGSAGRSASHTATFRSRSDALPLGEWLGRSISLEFRTYENVVTLISSSDHSIEVFLDGRHLRLLIHDTNVTLTPQSRFNDGGWHRLTVEVIDKSVRLTANEHSAFGAFPFLLESETPPTELFIGGGHEGLLGCVRQVTIDGKLLSVAELLKAYPSETVTQSCEDRCTLQDCLHDSRCVQHFDEDTVECVCRNNITHSGPHCENSINKGTEISLHDLKRGFLKILNPLPSDPLVQRIVLSVRTDRRDALLVYLHDHLYNFVQVHLSDYTRIILTLNFNRTVRRCEVTARVGHEFSRMQWLQIMLFQRGDRVQLNVDDEVCEVPYPRILSDEFIKQFEFDTDLDDVVEPPVSPGKTEDKLPFSLLFIGGVPTENYKGTLDPTYKSTVPTLLGCVRGLMFGNQLIDMHNNAFWPYYPAETTAVKTGCATGCEEVEPTCRNDGHCTFKWMNTEPDAKLATCDCSKTSYYGDYCDQDSGVTFAGKSVLVFNSGEILEKAIFDWTTIGEHSFGFAFAAIPDSIRPQQLVTINFNDNRQLEVVLCKNGSLNVGISTRNGYYVHTFAFNYSDGYRHFFQSFFGGKELLSITVDSSRFHYPTEVARGVSLANALTYNFGGILDSESHMDLSVEDDVNAKHNYSGCISNIDINLNVGRMHFKPIYYISNPAEAFAPYVSQQGDPLLAGPCSMFKIPGTLPALQNNVNAPEWDSPFVTERYQRPIEIVPTTERPKEAGGSSWWIIIVVIVVLLLIVLVVLLILFCCKKKSSNANAQQPLPTRSPNGGDTAKDGNYPPPEERSPLISNTDEKPLSRPTNITNNFDLPEPTYPLDRSAVNSPMQPKAATEGAALRRTAPLAHTNETNRLSTPPFS